MSAEATEIQILATATHPVHGRVIVFEESDDWVFVAQAIAERPYYGQDFRVSREQYNKEFTEEPFVVFEAECLRCGTMFEGGCMPDHQISRAIAKREAIEWLRGCCGQRKANELKFEWRKPA